MTDTTPAAADVAISAGSDPLVSSHPSPTVVTTAVSWYTPTSSRWIAYRGHTRLGSIDHVGAFIATNQHKDVLGAFVELADAQLAIADPQPADADMVRRSRAHRVRRDARLRRAALTAMGVLLIMLVAGAIALLTLVR